MGNDTNLKPKFTATDSPRQKIPDGFLVVMFANLEIHLRNYCARFCACFVCRVPSFCKNCVEFPRVIKEKICDKIYHLCRLFIVLLVIRKGRYSYSWEKGQKILHGYNKRWQHKNSSTEEILRRISTTITSTETLTQQQQQHNSLRESQLNCY